MGGPISQPKTPLQNPCARSASVAPISTCTSLPAIVLPPLDPVIVLPPPAKGVYVQGRGLLRERAGCRRVRRARRGVRAGAERRLPPRQGDRRPDGGAG